MRVPDLEPCPFKICDGSGFIITEDDRADPCDCYRRKSFLAYLGPPFKCLKKPLPKQSAFWVPGKTSDDPPEDLTKTNLFIRAKWLDFMGDMGYALGALWLKLEQGQKPTTFDFLYDSRIPDIHFGKESYSQLSKGDRDVTEYHNTIDSFGDRPDLLVVRLGVIGSKHKSLGPLILRILKTREANAKVTWVVEDPKQPYVQGLEPSFDSTVAEYLEEYQRVIIVGTQEVVPTTPVYSLGLDSDTVSEEELRDWSTPSYPARGDTDDMEIDGCGSGPKKKNSWFKGFKKGSWG